MTPLFYMVFNIQRVITRIQNPRWKRVKIFKPYRVSMKKCAVVLSQFGNSQLPDIVQKYFCIPDGAVIMDPTFQMKYVPAF